MTHSEFNHLLSSIKALSPEQMRQLRQELDSELAATAKQPAGQGSLGAMRDAAAELDEAAEHAMKRREQATAPQSILDMVDELRKQVPPEEFAKLPADGAKQLDHYLYGSPKRPTA
jgi:hypothetical protein